MANNKKILILGGGQMQVPIIQCANQMELYTIVADKAIDAPGFMYAKEKLLVSTMDIDKLREYCGSCAIDGILTTSDALVNVVAAIGASSSAWQMAVISIQRHICKKIFRRQRVCHEWGIC